MNAFSSMPDNVRAVVLAAVHTANLDFYTDSAYKQLFVHKDHIAPQFLNLVKQFIKGRLRFLVNYWAESKHTDAQKEKFATKIESLPMLIYANSSIGMNIHQQLEGFLDKTVVARFETIGSKFNTYFKN